MDNPMTPRLVELAERLKAHLPLVRDEKTTLLVFETIGVLSRLMAEGGLVGAATPSASLEEVLAILAHAEVLRARGSNDVPAFDLCVNAEKSRLRSILQANEVKRLSNPVDDGAVERALDARARKGHFLKDWRSEVHSQIWMDDMRAALEAAEPL